RGGLVRVPEVRDRRDWAQRPDEGCRPDARRLLQALRVEGPARRGGHHRGPGRSARRDGCSPDHQRRRGGVPLDPPPGQPGRPLAAIGSQLSRSDRRAREAATAGFVRLVDILAGKAGTADARRRALVAAATMIGVVTMSRMVTDPELSAEILREAEKSLMA